MYYVGICDDADDVCRRIAEIVTQYGSHENIDLHIKICNSGEELCDYLENEEPLDILFLDIELIKLSGIEVGKFIRNKIDDHKMQIIFISGKMAYAPELFRVQPTEFLVKPFSDKQITDVLQLSIRLLGKRSGKFEFQYKKEYYYIPYEKIMFFASEGRKIQVVTSDGEQRFYGRIKTISEQLPDNFWVIHKSFIVNFDYVQKYSYEFVELTNGMTLTISKPYRKEVRHRLLKEV